MENATKTLVSYEKERFEVPVEIAKLFSRISSELDSRSLIPLPMINSANLKRVIKFSENYLELYQPDVSNMLTRPYLDTQFYQWADKYFTEMSDEEMIELYQAAYYLVFDNLEYMIINAASSRDICIQELSGDM